MKIKIGLGMSLLAASVLMLIPNGAIASTIDKTRSNPGAVLEAKQETYRQRTWGANARDALNKFISIDKGTEEVMAYAHIAAASGRLNGWNDPTTLYYLEKVYSLELPQGGWGLPYAYDAFQDGTTNPITTIYAVTIADHVGKTFLEGYKAGVVPGWKIQWIVDKLILMPRVPVEIGQCIAYSDQNVDVKPGYCVHNVNAGVGAFLSAAQSLGFTNTGMSDLIVGIDAQESSSYNWSTKFWPYRDGKPALQDPDHNSYSAESMYSLDSMIGKDSASVMMQTTWLSDKLSPIAHMRLTSYPDGSLRSLGDKYFTSVANFIANPPAPAGNRLAQAAFFSARNIRGK